jgi:hypothetical protein
MWAMFEKQYDTFLEIVQYPTAPSKLFGNGLFSRELCGYRPESPVLQIVAFCRSDYLMHKGKTPNSVEGDCNDRR